MKRHVLLVARADVAVAFRNEIGGIISAIGYRRTTDPAGVATYYVAHGRVSDAVWDNLVTALANATDGVRDDQDWQGRPATVLADARWAIATDAGDLVAGFRLSEDEATFWESPRDELANFGLVPVSQDADDGIA